MAATAKAKRAEFAERLKRWRQPGSAGFFAFLDDVRPMIPSEKGGYQPFSWPNERVKAEVAAALDGDHRTIVLCWPRRHGKTVVAALIDVWRFLTRETEVVGVVANSANQTVDTAFRLVKTVFERTPYMKALIDAGSIKVGADWITYDALDNVIQGYPSNPSALYGKKLSVAQVSELHAARSDATYQVLASSTIDTEGGLVLVDSTVGPRSSPLYGLYNLARTGADPSIYFSHIEYRDLEDAVANGPKWISPAALRSRAAQMLPAEFAQQHLNQWGSASNALFPPAVIERCRDDYALSVEAIAAGRAHAVGGGLDRAMIFSLHGDRTVLCAVVKVVGEDDEQPHFYVLESRALAISTEAAIKRGIERLKRDHGMTHMTIERYEGQDLTLWAQAAGLTAELVHATPQQQALAFTTLAVAASEGRLHIHPSMAALFGEMETFEYELAVASNNQVTPRFAHAKGAHDDHVYALAWAVYSLREVELNAYELNGIECDAPGVVSRLCILNGGDLVPPCAEECRSFHALNGMYGNFCKRAGMNGINLHDFYLSRVKNIGAHSIRR